MRFLVLGGTVFLSAAVAGEAVARGHEVACLARAVSGSITEGARFIRADRDGGAAAYGAANGDWDAVIEVSWQPSHVRDALAALADRARHWTYVSSTSVYADQSIPGLDEQADVLEPLGPSDVAAGATYGKAKVACESACFSALRSRLHVSRPGLIGGPGDVSDRFGYWPARLARNRDDLVLVPDAGATPTQTIDVRDLATWIVTAAERGLAGTFNALGESAPLGRVLELARAAAEHSGRLVAVEPAWLLLHGVQPWSGVESLPLWLPNDGSYDGFARRSCAAALDAGLQRHPLPDTVGAALEFERASGLERQRKAGLSPAKETSLLMQWFAEQGQKLDPRPPSRFG